MSCHSRSVSQLTDGGWDPTSGCLTESGAQGPAGAQAARPQSPSLPAAPRSPRPTRQPLHFPAVPDVRSRSSFPITSHVCSVLRFRSVANNPASPLPENPRWLFLSDLIIFVTVLAPVPQKAAGTVNMRWDFTVTGKGSQDPVIKTKHVSQAHGLTRGPRSQSEDGRAPGAGHCPCTTRPGIQE